MALDYNSTNFNSYTSGVGALMQSARNGSGGGSGEGNITLFVSNIPTTLTRVSLVGNPLVVGLSCPCLFSTCQDGFRDLFSRAGVVKRAYIPKLNQPDRQTTYG